MALQEPALGDQIQGAILFVHGLGGNVNQAEVIRPLRMALPKTGWETLSIQMPLHDRQ